MARLVWESSTVHFAVALVHSVLESEAYDHFCVGSDIPAVLEQPDRHDEFHYIVSFVCKPRHFL